MLFIRTFLMTFVAMRVVGNPCQSLLVLVDIRSVGSRRLNSLRQIIDDRSELLKHNHIVRLSEAAASAVTPAPSSPSSSSVMAVKAAIESVRPQPQKHVVVCVLIPPTWIGSRAAYPALFLNGWDFTYLVRYFAS